MNGQADRPLSKIKSQPSAFEATRWVLIGTIGFRLLAIIGQALIVRLVDKEVFGIWRQIVSLQLIFLLAMPLSFDALLIREKLFARRYAVALSQALAVTGIFGILLSVFLLLIPAMGEGSILSIVIQAGNQWPALVFMGPIFLLQAIKLAAKSPLAAELNFKRLSIGEFWNGVITWIGGAVAIIFFPSAWALMAMYLIGELFEAWWFHRERLFRPLAVLNPKRWKFLRILFRRHSHFSVINTMDQTLNTASSYLPILVLGAIIANETAADYAVATQVLVLPVMLLVGSIWRVAFPSLSGVKEEELQRRCLRITASAAAFIAPVVFWFAIFAPTTIAVLAGSKYENVAEIVQWMVIFMVPTAVFSPISSIDMIRDRSEVGMLWNLAYAVGRLLILVYFAEYGALYAIAAFCVFSGAFWLIWITLIGWLVGCGLVKFFVNFLRFVPFWLLALGGFWVADYVTDGHLIFGPLLSIIPSLIYLGVVCLFFPAEKEMLLRLLRRG